MGLQSPREWQGRGPSPGHLAAVCVPQALTQALTLREIKPLKEEIGCMKSLPYLPHTHIGMWNQLQL